MFAFQLVARELMVKLLLRWLPMNQAKVFSVVLQVAADTIPAVRILHSQPGVVAMIRSKTLCNLFVAVQALESWRAGPELMATRTLGGSAQGLMSFGEGAGRDLCVGKSREEEREQKGKKKIPQSSCLTPFADITSDSRLAEDQEILRLSASKAKSPGSVF